jgi:IS5 family transposase
MKGKQTTLSMAGFDRYAKPTRREIFLAQMDKVVPWGKLCAVIEPVYPKAKGGAGRPPIGLERMLRIYFLQQWFNLSDPAVEEALYDSLSMRRFVGIDLGREPVPDETTVCKFRHLLEGHELGKALVEQVHRHLEGQGIKISRGTIVDVSMANYNFAKLGRRGAVFVNVLVAGRVPAHEGAIHIGGASADHVGEADATRRCSCSCR